ELGSVVAALAYDLLGRLVVAQSLIRRRAHLAALRPLAELDVGDIARLHPDGVARRGGLLGRVERRGVALERAQERGEAVELALGEARAHAAGVAQVPVLAHADEQRADAVAPAPLPRHPAADDDLLAVGVLDLDPGRSATAGL